MATSLSLRRSLSGLATAARSRPAGLLHTAEKDLLSSVPKSSGFASLVPGDQEKFTFKKFAKGPVPPIAILLGIAMSMNSSTHPDGSPKMTGISIKLFGPNGPM
eukprot:TRINITY_DN87385_c0_g1_i1.p2 TRINITY_DN87385_c0_g1~~TRINITY_DN87385_c0_g1_i1.p2  ORF type:complete len:104 (-),score=15.35 TRINITY_DN87385_c0_g1_i1:144-455(-)